MLLAVNYHYVRPVFDSPHPGIHGVTPSDLERQLKALAREGEFVDAGQILAALQGEARLPSRSIVITFDDGLREQGEYAWPVLRRMGVPALFFINTGPIANRTVSDVHKIHLLRSVLSPEEFVCLLRRHAVEHGIPLDESFPRSDATRHYRYDCPEVASLKFLLNFRLSMPQRERLIGACFSERFEGKERAVSQELYMDLHQIKALTKHECIGTHGHEHVPLDLLSRAAIEEQVALSAAYLQGWTGQRPTALSYPYGSYEACSSDAADIARKHGIQYAFTMERAVNNCLKHPYHLARISAADLDPRWTNGWSVREIFEFIPRAQWYRAVHE